MPLPCDARPSRAAAGFVLALVMLCGGLNSSLLAQESFHVRPLFSVAQVYDSNLFSSSVQPQADFVSRLSPGIDTGYRTRLVDFRSRYMLDLDHFSRMPAQTTAGGRHAASADLRYAPSRRVAVTIDAGFTRTHTPGELSTVTGLTFGRAAAERLEVRPTIVRELDSRTSGSIGYTFQTDRLAGAGMRAHGAVVGVDRELSRRNLVGLGYVVRRFAFSARRDSTSHVVRVGWTRPLTRLAEVMVHAGTGIADGAVSPDLLASVRQRTRPVDLTVTYARTQTTVIGVAGLIDAESITAGVSLAPRPGLEIQAGPGLSRTRQNGDDARAVRLAISADQRIDSRLVLRMSYEASAQRGRLLTDVSADRVARHVVQIGLSVQPLSRGARGANAGKGRPSLWNRHHGGTP
jgi:hypothetical protein